MRYPKHLRRIAKELEKAAPELPRKERQWSHLADYSAWGIVRGLYLASVYANGWDDGYIRDKIEAMGEERDYEFDEEVRSLHDLTWALKPGLEHLGYEEYAAQ